MDKYVIIRKNNEPFDVDKIQIDLSIKEYSRKPASALWASPTNAIYGWINWMIDSPNEFYIDEYECTVISLKDSARVLYINTIRDIERMPPRYFTKSYDGTLYFDFTEIAKDYDALELCDYRIGQDIASSYEEKYALFSEWHCQSICILNKDIIELAGERFEYGKN